MPLEPDDLQGFNALQHAFQSGNVTLLTYHHVHTGQDVPVLCVTVEEGQHTILVPFAVLLTSPPFSHHLYDSLLPPASPHATIAFYTKDLPQEPPDA